VGGRTPVISLERGVIDKQIGKVGAPMQSKEHDTCSENVMVLALSNSIGVIGLSPVNKKL